MDAGNPSASSGETRFTLSSGLSTIAGVGVFDTGNTVRGDGSRRLSPQTDGRGCVGTNGDKGVNTDTYNGSPAVVAGEMPTSGGLEGGARARGLGEREKAHSATSAGSQTHNTHY